LLKWEIFSAAKNSHAGSGLTVVTDTIRIKDFADKYPDAQKKSFSPEDSKMAPEWSSYSPQLLYLASPFFFWGLGGR
jgi:hypothetical protein